MSDKAMMKKTGFTLTELMITVAVVAILVAVGYPSYLGFVTDARRTEAMNLLLEAANLQEQYYLDHQVYATSVSQLYGNSPYYSTQGYYQLTTASVDASQDFILTATASAEQSSDTDCAIFTLDQNGTRGATQLDCWH